MTRKYYLDPETPATDVVGYYFCDEEITNSYYHTHNYCEIILIIDGELIHHINSQTFTLKKQIYALLGKMMYINLSLRKVY